MNQRPQACARAPASHRKSDLHAGGSAQARGRSDGGDERPARHHRTRNRTGSRRQNPRSNAAGRLKGELSGRYMVAVESLKNAQKYLTQVSPELLTTLRRHHDTFRAMLQINSHRSSRPRARCPKASCAASTPRSQRRTSRVPIRPRTARRPPDHGNITPLTVSRSL